MPRADLALRPELNAVLKYTDVQAGDLLTLSELAQVKDLDPAQTRWLLVDHNALTGQLEGPYSQFVVGCVDHHEDEGKVPADGDPRVVRKTGSCMSLVVESCRDTWDSLSAEADSTEVDAHLAHVALGPILIDTTNLTSKDKTTDTDVEAVDFIEAKLGSEAGYDREKFFDEVTRVKEDVSGLSYRDLFRKDYKQWNDGNMVLGVSSIVQNFDYMLSKIGDEKTLVQELREWAEEQHLDIASIMTTSHTNGFSRDLMVWALNKEAVKVVKTFVDKNKDELKLETWGDGKLDDTNGPDELRLCWRQKQTRHSRKQVAPMLRSAMKETPKL